MLLLQSELVSVAVTHQWYQTFAAVGPLALVATDRWALGFGQTVVELAVGQFVLVA